MPLYEYSCEKCEKPFEVTQGFNDPPVELCPTCGGPAKKLMSLGGFALKGGGWYTSDYKKKPSESGGSSSGTP